MKHFNLLKIALVAVIGAFSASSWSQVTSFDYTGALETYTAPVDVTMIKIEVRGAQGWNDGGQGAIMIGDFTVSP
jgi:hypothetical protein